MLHGFVVEDTVGTVPQERLVLICWEPGIFHDLRALSGPDLRQVRYRFPQGGRWQMCREQIRRGRRGVGWRREPVREALLRSHHEQSLSDLWYTEIYRFENFEIYRVSYAFKFSADDVYNGMF
jgi:hypothetical protein